MFSKENTLEFFNYFLYLNSPYFYSNLMNVKTTKHVFF